VIGYSSVRETCSRHAAIDCRRALAAAESASRHDAFYWPISRHPLVIVLQRQTWLITAGLDKIVIHSLQSKPTLPFNVSILIYMTSLTEKFFFV